MGIHNPLVPKTQVQGDDRSLVKEESVPDNMPGDVFSEEKNGDISLISRAMAEEEKKLQQIRVKEELEMDGAHATLNDTQFSKLDELLSQTQLYSEFLLENMEDITFNGKEYEAEKGQKRGRGRKRKASAKHNARKAKTAVAAMLTRSQECATLEDPSITEEERIEKEQTELVPLLTGGRLKSYQLKGVKWLISLWQNGLNGILADQMGLGKTVQTIGFLSHLKSNGLHGPYLVIAPLSTLSNWANEFSRFVPSMNVILYHGTRKERQEIQQRHMPRAISPTFPVILTSYEIAMNDSKHLSRYTWKYVVVDEGHRLKNTHCKLLRELRRFPIDNKLLLTGTPLQNNLAELWSLLNFILPDIFSSHEEFESWFDLSGKCSNEAQGEQLEEKRRVQVISKLHSILRPFLLRRMKEDVEQMLPRKKEIILYANMSAHQKQLQEHLVNKTLENHLMKKTENILGRPGMKGKLNNLVVQLRKNCNHPDLLESDFDGSYTYPPIQELVEQCGKFQLLDRLLAQLLARKHKIQEFNDSNSNARIFLLSTRAGGLGINLTAADTCILYDSDWNPQMDLQAMDRCHRIGQTRPVHVYRLATSHSVEGRMLKKAFGKLKLEQLVIGKGQFQQERSKANTLEEYELLALLQDAEDAEDKLIQTDISDEDLLKVLDRSDLAAGSIDDNSNNVPNVNTLPLKGAGWEVVIPSKSGSSMLSSVTS
ncbi:ATP-dependent DNA helicase DDM1-like isoform X2 [Aristolochia californica]|uniref:ATP-dependent DNA helicase DDM1-like isoform X2 n=1 Tax=Aristolochia californica TaxID=171875 RepID=UPI0035D7DAD9